MTIGIPRALFYWKRPHLWETFFTSLGFKVLLSPETNKEIIERGVKAADTETCFSIKVLYGHVLSLEEKVDSIFIPRFKKNELGLEYCPKFFALPDLFSILTKTPIVTAWLDLKNKSFNNILIKLAASLGKKGEIVDKAIKAALLKEKDEQDKKEREYFSKIKSPKKKIVLISHPYNLYDEYVNLNIKKKIEDLDGEIIFVDEIPFNENNPSGINFQREITPKFHWEFGQEMLARIRTIIGSADSSGLISDKDNIKIQGAIEISAFQCGCDAVLKEFIEKEFKENKIPFLYLLIDEQTGEAGMQTRLEAFFDTLS